MTRQQTPIFAPNSNDAQIMTASVFAPVCTIEISQLTSSIMEGSYKNKIFYESRQYVWTTFVKDNGSMNAFFNINQTNPDLFCFKLRVLAIFCW